MPRFTVIMAVTERVEDLGLERDGEETDKRDEFALPLWPSSPKSFISLKLGAVAVC
jgi:hypothetical protein